MDAICIHQNDLVKTKSASAEYERYYSHAFNALVQLGPGAGEVAGSRALGVLSIGIRKDDGNSFVKERASTATHVKSWVALYRFLDRV